MKKLIFIMILLVSAVSFSQGFKLKTSEDFSLVFSVDPVASFKEGGADVVAEIEYNWLLNLKVGVENFAALEGGYTSIHGGIGVNFTSGYFEDWIYTAGIRLGKIYRDENPYPLFGWEGMICYKLNDNSQIGLRGTADWREDFLYSGADPEYVPSGFITYKFTF